MKQKEYMEKIRLEADDGQILEFYVEEQARIGGCDYLLVSDSQEEESQAYILKDTSMEESGMAHYEFVEDDEELEAVSKIFEQTLEDADLEF